MARALAANPPVLLMDEPFGAVDPVVRLRLQDEFLRLHDELGETVVFVTHDIDEAVRLGDRVAVFATGGRLAQYDTAARGSSAARPTTSWPDFVGLHQRPATARGDPARPRARRAARRRAASATSTPRSTSTPASAMRSRCCCARTAA